MGVRHLLNVLPAEEKLQSELASTHKTKLSEARPN